MYMVFCNGKNNKLYIFVNVQNIKYNFKSIDIKLRTKLKKAKHFSSSDNYYYQYNILLFYRKVLIYDFSGV